MNKLNKILLLFILIINSCTSDKLTNKNINQSIDGFNMNFYTKNGEKLYSINSPNSSFNKEKNLFILSETTISLFNNNEAEYLIKSDNSKLQNNNLLKMNGNILIKAILHQNDKIYANDFIWNINSSEYLLNGNVKFENKSITLSSDRAILNKGSKVIEFFNPVKYIIKDSNNDNVYKINSENAYYNLDTKSVTFKSINQRVRSKLYF